MSNNSLFQMAISWCDILARAKDGIGKTGIYLIPMLDRIDTTKETIQAIVLVPTRKLAQELTNVFKEACNQITVASVTSVRDLEDKGEPLEKLAKTHVLIATPGRIVVLIESGLVLEDCKVLVLDQADKSDIPTVGRCLKNMEQSQIMLFCEHLSSNVCQFATFSMKAPFRITFVEDLEGN